MKKPFIYTVVFLALILISTTEVFSAPPENFTAEMTVSGLTMKMAKMGNNTRIENQSMPGLVSIFLGDEKKIIYLSTAKKKYVRENMTETPPPMFGNDVVFDKKPLGPQTIDGHPCEKYDAVFYKKDKPDEKIEAIIWEAADFGNLIIRYEYEAKDTEGKSTMITAQLRNIQTGTAKSYMFELPKDYKKVAYVSELTTGTVKHSKKNK
ncbi:MAG: hypothetical protein H7844_04230 [Nitrospirae bacterium YQR-1]